MSPEQFNSFRPIPRPPVPPPARPIKLISTTDWKADESIYYLQAYATNIRASTKPIYPKTTEFNTNNPNLVKCSDGTWDVTNGFVPACYGHGGIDGPGGGGPDNSYRMPSISRDYPEPSSSYTSRPPLAPVKTTIVGSAIPYPFPAWQALGGGAFNAPSRSAVYGKLTNPPINSYRFVTNEQLVVIDNRPEAPARENWVAKPPSTFVSATLIPNGQNTNWGSDKDIDGNQYPQEWFDSNVLSSNLFKQDYILVNSSFSDVYTIPTNLFSWTNKDFYTNGCWDTAKVTHKVITNTNLSDLLQPYSYWEDNLYDTNSPRSLVATKTSYYGLLTIPRNSIKKIPFGRGFRYQFDTQWINCEVTWRIVLSRYNREWTLSNKNHICGPRSIYPSDSPIPSNIPVVPIIEAPEPGQIGSRPPAQGGQAAGSYTYPTVPTKVATPNYSNISTASRIIQHMNQFDYITFGKQVLTANADFRGIKIPRPIEADSGITE